ncbi:uncharacterized protein BYT42DRAFT_563511 [Radiomyces spectabilis]|uniref:uncharacterized protein n=1 Tax=Radiomyces spectabilis TaxID=64574 RepID=UPI00221F9ED1|nr:uncharacterized protein BYT42DRAFT_563511 [Radiomyces spectabilis]KAI8384741.1 hypothetical protein BYT42DRAFT_563511 [Radiomyces spectabilis]
MDTTNDAPEKYNRWRQTKSSSTGKPRNVDRELQRIKSLAVVSVLNKTFAQDNGLGEKRGPTPSPSVSIPTTLCKQKSSSSLGLGVGEFSSRNRKTSTNSLQMDWSPSFSTPSRIGTSTIRLKTEKLRQLEDELLRMYETAIHQTTSLNSRSEPSGSVKGDVSDWVVTMQPSISSEPQIGSCVQDSIPEKKEEEDEVDGSGSFQPDNIDRLQERIRTLESDYAQALGECQEAQEAAALYREQQMQLEHLTQMTVNKSMEEKELAQVKIRQLATVIFQQDELIHGLELDRDMLKAENQRLQAALKDTSFGDRMETACKELDDVKSILYELAETKESQQQRMAALWGELDASQGQTWQMVQQCQDLQAEFESQRIQIDEKISSLMRQLLDNKTREHPPASPVPSHPATPSTAPPPAPQERRVSRGKLMSSIPIRRTSTSAVERDARLKEVFTDDSVPDMSRFSYASSSAGESVTSMSRCPERPIRSARRGSAATCTSKRSYIARWTGTIPPAAPPPTDPLPPIPMSPTPHPLHRRSLSPSTRPFSSLPTPMSLKHVSVDAVMKTPKPDQYYQDGDDASYREFAEQLQVRLSVSKEIDELRVWNTHDLDDLQKRSSQVKELDPMPVNMAQDATKRSSLVSKDSPAFWKEMKKKLRV